MGIISEVEELSYIRNFPEKEAKLNALFLKIQKLRLNKDFSITMQIPKKKFLIITPSFLKVAHIRRIRTFKDLITRNPFSSFVVYENEKVRVFIIKNKKPKLQNSIATIIPVFFENALLKVYFVKEPIIYGLNSKFKIETILGKEVSIRFDKRKLPLIIMRSQIELEKLLEMVISR